MKKQSGFTLIELMIVIVIIGILAAIAYPSYQGALREARRGMAEGDLMAAAGFLERQYTTNPDYSSASMPTSFEAEDHYNFSLTTSASGARFTLSATPTGDQASDYCGTLTLDSTNTKGSAVAGCW
jgi:type IV pilus assembly protein PilE